MKKKTNDSNDLFSGSRFFDVFWEDSFKGAPFQSELAWNMALVLPWVSSSPTAHISK